MKVVGQFQIIINHSDIENIGIVQNEAHIALPKAMFDAHVNSNILTPWNLCKLCLLCG